MIRMLIRKTAKKRLSVINKLEIINGGMNATGDVIIVDCIFIAAGYVRKNRFAQTF